MVEIVNEHAMRADNLNCVIIQELSDGSRREILKRGDEVFSTKTIQKDGSYILVNKNNIKTEELTSDGYYREYDAQTQKLKREVSPQKVVRTFYDNGKVETVRDEQKGKYTSYYENGNLCTYEDKSYEIYLNDKGNVNYELKDGKLTINPDWFSYYRLGFKTSKNQYHWQEKGLLKPDKKTLVCLGGSETKEARKANGNINGFVSVIGLSLEDISKMQLVACYRPYNQRLRFAWRKARGFAKHQYNDYKREIMQKFMPFMARWNEGKWERLTINELYQNFRNIMFQAHCYGANDLPYYSRVFKETMTKLGYEKSVQQHALKQIICITNNTQRDLGDNLGFTCIHRYSVKDGQNEAVYDTKYSADYPVFVQDYKAFAAQKGHTAAFVATKPHEMFMAFDKILRQGSEHNDAFWTVDKEDLTTVGNNQAHLMARIGRLWYHNHENVPNVSELVQQAAENSILQEFVNKAFALGKEIKSEKNNVLANHHILKSEWNKFKASDIEAPKTGVYKLLSDKYRE